MGADARTHAHTHRPLTAAQRDYAALDAMALLWIKDTAMRDNNKQQKETSAKAK